MAQLLCADATNTVPSLKNIFLVGDVFTKRDCARLRSIAPHAEIVNMFGSTETQRAVSHFTIPAQSLHPGFLDNLKDNIPVGRGMKDVQLLVINRADLETPCGIGELGELFVRAGGLAEGYRQLPELTKEKFVTNWMAKNQVLQGPPATSDEVPWLAYYHGPRDRLYRTGDLGRYLPNGDGTFSSFF
jgi:L-aminoadipate-semialdehyde dehydrogenase